MPGLQKPKKLFPKYVLSIEYKKQVKKLDTFMEKIKKEMGNKRKEG